MRVLYIDASRGISAESLLHALAAALAARPLALPDAGPLVRPRDVDLPPLAEDVIGILLVREANIHALEVSIDSRVLASIVASVRAIEELGVERVLVNSPGPGSTPDGLALVECFVGPDGTSGAEPQWIRVAAEGRAKAPHATRVVLGETESPSP